MMPHRRLVVLAEHPLGLCRQAWDLSPDQENEQDVSILFDGGRWKARFE